MKGFNWFRHWRRRPAHVPPPKDEWCFCLVRQCVGQHTLSPGQRCKYPVLSPPSPPKAASNRPRFQPSVDNLSICRNCGRRMYQHDISGDGAWCHTITGRTPTEPEIQRVELPQEQSRPMMSVSTFDELADSHRKLYDAGFVSEPSLSVPESSSPTEVPSDSSSGFSGGDSGGGGSSGDW